MASPVFRLEEQLSDQRSDQVAYKLTIENDNTEPLRLLSVKPRVPQGANLLQITDTSLAENSARRAELIEELNVLLRQFLWVASDQFRRSWVDRQVEAAREIFSFAGLFSAYLKMLASPKSFQARLKREAEAYGFRVASAPDARAAYDRWMRENNEHEAIRSLFEAKTLQLEGIEARMNEGERNSLTELAPASHFTATYVLKFRRGILEPKKYHVGFEATYKPASSETAAQTASTATNVQISPHPINLSLVAIISAVFGALLKISLTGSQSPLVDLIDLAKSGHLLVGPIVALIFFNIYEYTSIGKEIGMAVSWRSALLIGSLSGIAQDRILGALKALIGA